MTRIKICGLSRPEDVDAVNRARPDFCGFVVNFPASRRSVTEETLRALRGRLCDAVTPVGVFVDQPAEAVARLQNEGAVAVAQLHGGEDEAYLACLRRLTGGKPVWKAFRVRSEADLAAARASSADLVLLDNGQGTGQMFDWSLLAHWDRPFFLAGGLTPQTLPAAIRTLRPWGVDLSSGVETAGYKDPQKIQAAVAAAREE
ncbi:MAG: phosphoribosylanthranilate isomerase [Oscillibacter sp.]|nr:phosphoribosylanthranilate isomerase [Oscillibacter sp.]